MKVVNLLFFAEIRPQEGNTPAQHVGGWGHANGEKTLSMHYLRKPTLLHICSSTVPTLSYLVYEAEILIGLLGLDLVMGIK